MKQTLFISSPCSLRVKNEQLNIVNRDTGETFSRSIKETGFILVENPRVTITATVFQMLSKNNVALIFCDRSHLPCYLSLPLSHHYLSNERQRLQINSKEKLRKQLWKQLTVQKIKNQAHVLKTQGMENQTLLRHAGLVKNGDTENREAQAGKYYWGKVFNKHIAKFKRDRFGVFPNNLLNYGYAILRSATGRSIVGAGLLPNIGVHHHNRYDHFALANDLMEPYRQFIDMLAIKRLKGNDLQIELTKNDKELLLSILTLDCIIDKKRSPLGVAINKTAHSLVNSFKNKKTELLLPQFSVR